ncbi:MAG: hypothetical protein V4492_02020, partial [Chlamydiota bacterium]
MAVQCVQSHQKLWDLAEKYKKYGDAQDHQVRAYIKTVLLDAIFRADPTLYVSKWTESKCSSSRNHFPQEDALAFFQENKAHFAFKKHRERLRMQLREHGTDSDL